MTNWMHRIAVAAMAAALGAGAITAQAQPRGPERHDDRGSQRDRSDHRGAGPDHRWVRGSRVPPEYREHIYVVNDWRGHRLSSPPRGYHWIQSGGDYLLVAIASGVIAQIVFGN
ncbi:RcnB family protein [Comamonas odontotermitis]|uniref:RcnB family protein n=1 Tax=Comamonas odontotermitis TaxID=379895 RepID=UPI0037511E4C